MNYNEIFQAYYTLYRAESETPPVEDEEYIVGMRLANESISRWLNYDNTLWEELYTTVLGSGSSITVTADSQYDAPGDMLTKGGVIMVKDTNGSILKRYHLIEPHQTQTRTETATYAYFTGTRATGYSFTVNPAPEESLQGKSFDFVYYRTPTLISNGTSVPDMRNPYFIVHRMLANRFRASRNWSAYQTAIRDSEEALKVMQLENNSGSWTNPWTQEDNSGTIWGL